LFPENNGFFLCLAVLRYSVSPGRLPSKNKPSSRATGYDTARIFSRNFPLSSAAVSRALQPPFRTLPAKHFRRSEIPKKRLINQCVSHVFNATNTDAQRLNILIVVKTLHQLINGAKS
jgi:hypothetical protein